MKKLTFLGILIIISIIIFIVWNYKYTEKSSTAVNNFEKCIAKGYPILVSYPRQCRTPDGKTFIEDVGNELEKQNLIRVSKPRPNEVIKSPLMIEGEARGSWFFEADFPVYLLDNNGKELWVGIARTKSEWMTEDFIPFKATLEFQTPTTEKKGVLILEKDNPSGLSENSDKLLIPVHF